jgi:hypothetical protein
MVAIFGGQSEFICLQAALQLDTVTVLFANSF